MSRVHARRPLADHDSALTHDQKTALAGQIARACAVFCVDEIVVFDDGQAETRPREQGGYSAFADPNFFLYHLLSYLETPPHLRKSLFPMHPDLRTAGTLPSLDMPHHLKAHEWCRFREGVTVGSASSSNKATPQTAADCGLPYKVHLPGSIPGTNRVTLQLPREAPDHTDGDVKVEAVSPNVPREQAGYYWGYSVRQASSLGDIFTECEFDGGYDLSIGLSERGLPLASVLASEGEDHIDPTWSHLLIVLGGVAGLEAALAADLDLKSTGIREVATLFDRWINLVSGQGSRTIRTEEAVWIGLSGLRPLIEARQRG